MENRQAEKDFKEGLICLMAVDLDHAAQVILMVCFLDLHPLYFYHFYSQITDEMLTLLTSTLEEKELTTTSFNIRQAKGMKYKCISSQSF
jgi:hypothetical protein